MTENEFFRNALLQLAGNSAFKPECNPNNKEAIKQWANEIEMAATELLEAAVRAKCGVNDVEDRIKVEIVSKPP